MKTMPTIRWHHATGLSIALTLSGLAAVLIGLDDPHSTDNRSGLEHSAVQRQQDRADAIAGFPVAPHPDAPPRGPGD